eukprot:scaffold9386_cov154-Ochromonas_danica.AAC.4
MAELDKKIAGLEGEIEGYKAEYQQIASSEDKRLLLQTINTTSKTLNRLLDEKKKSLPQGENRPFGIPCWNDQKFNVFGHGIGLAQLAIGLLAGGGFYAVKHHQRATTKFFKSLLATSKHKLSKIDYSVLPRANMHVGIDKEPLKKLNLHSAFKSVALIGDNRSGKTIFLCNTKSATVDAWLKNQIATTEKEDPWSAVADLLGQRREEQRVRVFLHTLFKTKLPTFLKPQPAIIVVDQAEELLRAYRAEFLVGFYNLVKEGRDDDLFRLVLVINTENAVKALELMNGGNMFDVITAPKVSREAVVEHYGDEFAKVFDDCDCCIGVALDYVADKKRPKDMTAKEYAALKKEKYASDNCLAVEITREEYTKTGEHVQK